MNLSAPATPQARKNRGKSELSRGTWKRSILHAHGGHRRDRDVVHLHG